MPKGKKAEGRGAGSQGQGVAEGTLATWENGFLPPQAREEAGNGVKVRAGSSWGPEGMFALSLGSLL